MRKGILAILLTFVFVLLIGISSHAGIDKLHYDGKWHEYNALPIFLEVDGEEIDAPMPPIVFGEHSLVPAREVFEAMGAKITWNNRLKIAKISYGDTRIYLTINNIIAKVNDEDMKLDVPAKIINEKTMIPTRFVSEQLGFKVEWNEDTRTIHMASKPDSIIIENVRYLRNPLSGMIQNVAYKPSNSRIVQVDIKASDEINDYSTLFLKEPYRLVVDVSNSILSLENTLIPINENGIDQVRMSQFEVDPDKTRVVIDLKEALKYKVYLSNDKKNLKVDILLDDNVLQVDEDQEEYVVVIDPGHGGTEPGAIYSGISEKSLNLNISLRLKKLLEEENIKVIMTRQSDTTVDLFSRAPMANSINADLFVSIHNNAMEDRNYKGTMTLYKQDGKSGFNNKKFAQIMQKEVVSSIGTVDLGLRERPGLVVLKTAKVPAVLVEVAFMTNSSDMSRLRKSYFLQDAAEGLRDGIVKALNEKNK